MGPSGMKAYAISTQRHETTATEPYVSAKVGSISFAIVRVGALALCVIYRGEVTWSAIYLRSARTHVEERRFAHAQSAD